MREQGVSGEDSDEAHTPTTVGQGKPVKLLSEYLRHIELLPLKSARFEKGNSFARAGFFRLFGDIYGLTLFVGALAFFMSYWRIGVAISDSYAIANGLVAVSEGQLHVERAVYGGRLDISSMAQIDGQWYARNYGQIFLALPFLWLVQGVAMVTDLRIALAGGWSLLLLSLGLLVGQLLDRDLGSWDSRSVGVYAGSVVALLAFVLVIRGATPIVSRWHHLMALQLQTMVAAGLLGVVIYRLLTRMYDRRVGLASGVLVVFASPIAFWAAFPKRHVSVALAVFISIYCLYRSREPRTDGLSRLYRTVRFGGRSLRLREATIWRAAVYVPVGFVAWVNSLEGFLLLAGLLLIDVPTGGPRFRELVAAGTTCLVSLVPFFVTNILITGNPLESPMTHRTYGNGGVAGKGTGGGAGGGGGGTGSSGEVAGEAVSSTTLDSFLGVISVASDLVDKGVSVVTTDPNKLFNIFLHSGYVNDFPDGGNALRLSYLEAMPVAAVLFMLPIICLRCDIQGRLREIIDTRYLSPGATIDAFVVAYATAATLVYAPRFPLPAQITIRYLLVLFPLTAYGMMRIQAVRRVVREQGIWYYSAYLMSVLVGGQLLFLYMYLQGVVVDEAFQIHSYVGLGIASLVAGWVLVEATGQRLDRLGAIVLGLGAAASTVFVLLIVLWFSTNGEAVALPVW